MPAVNVLSRVAAGTTYAPYPYPKTKVPTGFERHMLNRMGCGYSRATWDEMKAAGGAVEWFEQQLDPASVPENARADSILGWFPRLTDSPATKWSNNQSKTYPAGSTPATTATTRPCGGSTPTARCSRPWSTSGTTTCTSR